MKLTKEEMAADEEAENCYGYTESKQIHASVV